MNKIYLLFVFVAYSSLYAQTLFENFDSYTVGDYIGIVSPEFTTWSGATGGSEDVTITSDQAYSGSNSIYLSTSVAAGGPQDIVVPFGGKHTTGVFTFEAQFFIEDGKGAYFNFQGEEEVGEIWAMNCQMVNDNRLLIDAGGPVLLETTYVSETWFKLKISINLNINEWTLLIDDIPQGTFSVVNNAVAALNIYPVNAAAGGNNQAGYFVDDVSFEHTPYTLPGRNGAVTSITNTSGLATTEITPTATIRNLGTSVIESFDIAMTYNGTTITENITGVSIETYETYAINFTDELTLIGGENEITATLSNINELGADDVIEDDTKTLVLDPTVPAEGKMVVAEEGTGTWCGWCPRGAVFLERMTNSYPDHFIGIAVHNGGSDPMTVENYDAGMSGLISGYPSVVVDRGDDIDPSAIETDLLERVVINPTAIFSAITSDYTAGATTANISFNVRFNETVSGDYRLACVLTEDGVTGTSSGYAQANAYAGGGAGEMGGYELLPSPVPASEMVYDHVARGIWPSFEGLEGSFPDEMVAGETYTVNFSVAIDAEWDITKVHVVGLFIDPSGKVDNAGVANLDQVTGVSEVLASDASRVSLFPNPAKNYTNVLLEAIDNNTVSISVFDLNGKQVAVREYGKLSGDLFFPLDLYQLSKGIYAVEISIDEQIITKKLVVE